MQLYIEQRYPRRGQDASHDVPPDKEILFWILRPKKLDFTQISN
jgi:hypothetical protein